MAAPKKTATKLTVEKKATVISKATHEKVVAEKDALIKEKKSEITTAKKNALDWEERAIAAEHKLAEIGANIGTKEKKFLGWAVAHWIYTLLGLAVIALLFWVYVLHGQRDGLQTKFDNCQRSKSDVQTKAASDSAKKNVTDLRSETGKIGETPTPEVKKNGTK